MMGWFDGFADLNGFDEFDEFDDFCMTVGCGMSPDGAWRHDEMPCAIYRITDRIANSIFSGYGGISNGNWTNNMPICLYSRENISDGISPDFNSVLEITEKLRDFPNDSQTPHTPCRVRNFLQTYYSDWKIINHYVLSKPERNMSEASGSIRGLFREISSEFGFFWQFISPARRYWRIGTEVWKRWGWKVILKGSVKGGRGNCYWNWEELRGVNRERVCARDADSDPMISTGDVFMCGGDGKLMRSRREVDRKLMGSWWEVDGKLMGSWWEVDEKLMG